MKLTEAQHMRRLLFRISERPLPECLCRFIDLIRIEWPADERFNWKPAGLQERGFVRRRNLMLRAWPWPWKERQAVWTITDAGRRALEQSQSQEGK